MVTIKTYKDESGEASWKFAITMISLDFVQVITYKLNIVPLEANNMPYKPT